MEHGDEHRVCHRCVYFVGAVPEGYEMEKLMGVVAVRISSSS